MNHFIYVIGPEVGPLKIGRSLDPEVRLAHLQTGHEAKLMIHYTRATSADLIVVMEKIVHRELRHKRLRGEWFNISVDDARALIDHAFIRYEEVPNLAMRWKARSI
jgi:hypothetical protein